MKSGGVWWHYKDSGVYTFVIINLYLICLFLFSLLLQRRSELLSKSLSKCAYKWSKMELESSNISLLGFQNMP